MPSSNSSTASKNRQHQARDVKFSQAIKRIRATGQVNEDYKQFDGWKRETLEQLNAAALEDRIDTALTSLTKLYPQLVFHIAVEDDPDQDTAEDQDKRFRKDATGKKVIRLYSIDDIYQTPDADYLISRILEEATTSLLYGVSGTGKTFTALHIGLCIAHGEPWHKRKVKQGVVWYINTEGARGLKKRLKAWYTDRPDYQPSPSFKVIPWSLNLREHFQELQYTIEQEQQKPALIIIDNFSMCTPEVNQKNQEDVAPVLALINTLAQEQECHVMIIHHTTKEGDFNGSMAFRNHVDTMIELRKEDKADKDSAILFTSQKSRDDELFRDIKTELKVVSLGINQVTHEEITSCVVVESSEPVKREGLKDTPQNILDILGEATYSYTQWSKEAINELHIAKKTFDRARDELVEKGYVCKVKVENIKFEQYRKVAPAEQGKSSTESEQGNEE